MSFIRRKRVHKRTSEGRKDYFYYYRVENYRIEDCPKPQQRVLDYLGTAEEAIAKLESLETGSEEKSRLLLKLQKMVGKELGTTTQSTAIEQGAEPRQAGDRFSWDGQEFTVESVGLRYLKLRDAQGCSAAYDLQQRHLVQLQPSA